MSDGHSESRVYTVEARLTHSAALGPAMENGMALDGEWRRVRFPKSPIGVPHGLPFNELAVAQGYLSLDSATALAWWFLASCDRLAVETRLVEHKFVYDFKSEPTGHTRVIQRNVWSDFGKDKSHE